MSTADKRQLSVIYVTAGLLAIAVALVWSGSFGTPKYQKEETPNWFTEYSTGGDLGGIEGQSSNFTGNFVAQPEDVNQRTDLQLR